MQNINSYSTIRNEIAVRKVLETYKQISAPAPSKFRKPSLVTRILKFAFKRK